MTHSPAAVPPGGVDAVAAPHLLATRAGAASLRDGGNAVDAALAAAAVLAVVYPHQCTIGGDLVALVGTPDGRAWLLNGTGRAPRLADVAALRARTDRMPLTGAWPVTVPGVVDAWHELARRWGSRPLAGPLRAAAALARDGVPVSPGLARELRREAGLVLADPGLREVLAPGGEPLAVGATFRQPRLAETLELIAAGGRDAFHTGEVARSLVRFLAGHGSALTEADLAMHRAVVAEPAAARFGPVDYLAGTGNTQGGYFLVGLRVLDLLAQRAGRPLDPVGADAGTIARVLAALAGLRDAHLGDPATAPDLPLRLLADPAAVARLAEAADGGQIPPGLPPGLPPGPLSGPPPGSAPRGDTVAVVAADRAGGFACLIQSVFHAFGCGLLDPGTGVLLHNRGAAFDLAPGSAGEARGGARPPHTLMPVLVRDAAGRLIGAHGTMGGRGQPQIQTHLAHHLAAGRTPAEAVAAPRWVIVATPDRAGPPAVQVEPDVPAPARSALARELPVVALDRWDDGAGHAQVVRAVLDPAGRPTGRVLAGSDPRADGGVASGEG